MIKFEYEHLLTQLQSNTNMNDNQFWKSPEYEYEYLVTNESNSLLKVHKKVQKSVQKKRGKK